MTRILTYGLAMGLLALAGPAGATVNADYASNYGGGWTNGTNGGGGFEPWSIESDAGAGSAGNGIWASADAGLEMGDAFGFTARGEGAFIHLDRSFTQAMAVGDTFSFDLAMNYNAGTGGSKGFVMRSADNREIITVNQADSDTLTVNGVAALTAYGTGTMHWTFRQKSATQIEVYATGRSGSEAYTTTITTTATSYLANIRFYATSVADDEYAAYRAVYFDNLVLSQAAVSGTYTYTTENSRTTITGISADASGAVLVPATYGGYTVTEIGRSAFKDRTNITSITFASGANVTKIGPGAFQGCTGLRWVVLPSGLAAVPAGLFHGCTNLGWVTIPSGVTSIGDAAFTDCRNLAAPTLPASLKTLGESVFLNCRSLVSLDIPSTVTAIPGQLCYECRALASIDLPAGVTTIGYSAFHNCTSLTTFALPAGVTAIGHDAFHGCANLASFHINSALASIGNHAFYDCRGLASITVDAANAHYSSLGGVLFNNLQTKLILYPAGLSGAYTIPSTVADIGDEAFAHCHGMTPVTIPSTVTSVGNDAFYYCSTLAGATFAGNAPGMGTGVFNGSASSFTVYYHGGSGGTGFTSPTWTTSSAEIYPAIDLDASSPIVIWLGENGFPIDTDILSDPNSDGVNLLMAYALGLDPKLNLAGSLPQPVLTHGSPGTLAIEFHGDSEGVTYRVETSTDLETWTTDGVTLSVPDEDGLRTATVAVAAGDTARFLRLVITY